jgi:hypothetical protein
VNLASLEAAGYVTDEWERWQQGQCGTYALALLRMQPSLRLGVCGITGNGGGDASGGWMAQHFYAHDDTHAYDSAGRHVLPYLCIDAPDIDYAELDARPADRDLMSEEGTGEQDIAAAQAHARRHGTLALLPVTSKDIFDFTFGGCYLLAEEIERVTGWERAAFWDGFRVAGHVFAAMPDGRFADITGAHTRAGMMATHWARPGKSHGKRGITRNVGPLAGWRLEQRYEDELRARARELVPVLLAQLDHV